MGSFNILLLTFSKESLDHNHIIITNRTEETYDKKIKR